MTRIATMGTSSCATIAIAGFKAEQKTLNDAYLANPEGYKLPAAGHTVEEFYNKVLYPVSQPLGHTKEYPFELLMTTLDKSPMSSKFMIATLNWDQYQNNDGYWPAQLEKHGFRLLEMTKNDIGSMCFIYVRNNNKVD